MSIDAIVHGYIECNGCAWEQSDRRIFRHNKRVILNLPESDPEWPFLSKSMFSMLPLRPKIERCIPQHCSQLIYFAGDYKNMYRLEAEWIAKFENLLRKLCWLEAVVIHEFAALRYEWQIDDVRIVDKYRGDPPIPPHEWTFACYHVKREPRTLKDAVDGEFASTFHKPPKNPR